MHQEARVLIDCIVCVCLYVCTTYAAATVTVEICMQFIHQVASAYANACYLLITLFQSTHSTLHSTCTCFVKTLNSSTEQIQPIIRNPAIFHSFMRACHAHQCMTLLFTCTLLPLHLIRPFLAKMKTRSPSPHPNKKIKINIPNHIRAYHHIYPNPTLLIDKVLDRRIYYSNPTLLLGTIIMYY